MGEYVLSAGAGDATSNSRRPNEDTGRIAMTTDNGESRQPLAFKKIAINRDSVNELP